MKMPRRREPDPAPVPATPAVPLLVIDPSSTCTGYAVFDRQGVPFDFGRLTPESKSDKANARIRVMAREMQKLIGEYAPSVVVIEDTSGKVSGRHGGGGAGLSIYGKAVGWMIATAESCADVRVQCVLENEWTKGKKKSLRLQTLANVRGYDPAADPGGDAGDAIMLGFWWIAQYRLDGRVH